MFLAYETPLVEAALRSIEALFVDFGQLRLFLLGSLEHRCEPDL